MPPKPNGFYMYMIAEQKKLKAQTNRVPNMKEMATICRESWQRMSATEKARFDALAKQEKAKLSTGDGNWAKLDCHRHVIADRKDPVKEENKRREQERRFLQNSFSDKDIRDITFHILDFQVMYDDIMEDDHFPVEIGMVSISLRKGVINFMHRFINPGEVPQGNRHLAVSYSENHHKIPLNFEHADANFKALTNHIKEFMKADSETDDTPPVFCLSIHRHSVESCLDFIYQKTFVDEASKIHKIYCLEDLVTALIMSSGTVENSVSESQVFDLLRQNRWDYNSSIRCFYHEELDCSDCSLSIVRRYSFALFDVLSTLLQFELTDKHMPEESEPVYVVTESFGFGRRNRFDVDDNRRNRFRDPPSDNFNSSRNHYEERQGANSWRDRSQAWQMPKVEPVKIPVMDEDEESEEEDEQPKAEDYTLKKLRLPKCLSQAQNQMGQLNVQEDVKPVLETVIPPPNPNPAPLRPRGVSNAAPMRPMVGRGVAPSKLGQIRPMGVASSTIRPPPGFGPMPGMRMSVTRTLDQEFPALGRGRGGGRGRGALPQ